MESSLRERFARLGPVQAIARAPSGSPARYVLRATDPPYCKTIDAAEALAYRHLALKQAKRTIERVQDGETVAVELPMLEDAGAFESAMAACGVRAERRDIPAEIDVKSIREDLGLTQEEFAVRFGLDVSALRNWEQRRTKPEAAVRSLFRVIQQNPAAVERALAS